MTMWPRRVRCSLQEAVKSIAIFDIVLFLLTIGASVTVEKIVCQHRPIKLSWYLELELSGVNATESRAIWDRVHNFVQDITHCAPGFHYFVFTVTLFLVIGYILLEVWLCCILLRGANEVSISSCHRWMCWRVFLLILVFGVSVSDVAQMQYTCTDLAILPLNAFRVVSILVVYLFIRDVTLIFERPLVSIIKY